MWPVLEWAQLSEEKLHWVFCCALWKLAPTEPGRSAAVHSRAPGWVNVSDRDKVLGITVSPQQPSAQGSPASEQKVKMLNSTTKLTESFVLKLHINSWILRKKLKNIIWSSYIFLEPCKRVNNKLLSQVLWVVLTRYCLLSFFYKNVKTIINLDSKTNISNFQMIFIQHKR